MSEAYEEKFTNLAQTTLSAIISSSGATSITVTSASVFPSSGRFRVRITNEILLVTGGQGTTTWTVVRGQESTTATTHANGAKVTLVLTEQSLKNIIASNPIGEEDQGVYLLACHKSSTEFSYLMVSNDGVNWNLASPKRIFTPVSGNQRDPSILQYDNQYWLAHTNSTNTFWTLLKSSNLVQWEKVVDVSMTSIATVHRVWAPEFFIDDDGTIRVFTTCSTGGSVLNFQVYEQHATATNLTTWSAPVILTGTSLRANIIDAFCIKKAGEYHIWYKDDDTKFIETMKSATLTSGYVKDKVSNWAGWGSGLEAPTLVKLNESTWRIYLNENSGLDSLNVYYSDSSNDWATWSTKALVTSPWIIAHPSVLRIRDFQTLRHIIGTFIQKNRTMGVEVTRSTSQSIANVTGTAIIWSSADKDDDVYWASGTPTRLTAPCPGWYSLTTKVAWAANTTGKRVVDFRFNNADFRGTQSVKPVTDHDNPDISTSVIHYMDEDDYVEIVVFQNSGGSLNVTSARCQMLRLP